MNTVRALECLAFAALSAPELAASLQVSVRTARRLLQRLALEGFVTQEPGHRRRYQATLRLAALGRQLLDHAPLAQAAAPRVARSRRTPAASRTSGSPVTTTTSCAPSTPMGGPADPTVSVLCEVAAAPQPQRGTVLLPARAQLRSCCYIHQTAEPTFAAAVLERGHVVAALGVTGDTRLTPAPPWSQPPPSSPPTYDPHPDPHPPGKADPKPQPAAAISDRHPPLIDGAWPIDPKPHHT